MEFWETLNLSPGVLNRFVGNLDVVKRILDDDIKSNLFFSRFPYSELFNFSVEDGTNVLLCTKILSLFVEYNEFVINEDRFNYTLEFILINLANIKRDCKEILLLMELLAKVLGRNARAIDSTFKHVFDRARILEAMLHMATFDSIQKSNFVLYSTILESLLIDSSFPDTVNNQISKLFDLFDYCKSVAAQISICKIVLKNKDKIWQEEFFNVLGWLSNSGPLLITKNSELVEDIAFCLIRILEGVTDFKNSDHKIRNTLSVFLQDMQNNLMKTCSDICICLNEARYLSNCLKLLKCVIFTFLTNENVTFSDMEILNYIDNLPNDSSLWPKHGNDLFLCICHLCLEHSRLIWKPLEILEAIKKCFYKNRNTIQTFVLKSIYYLYPILIDIKPDFSYKMLGDDLLNYFSHLCTIPYFYSHNIHQLKWILTRAPLCVKFRTLTYWLNYSNEEDLLLSTIQDSNASSLILQLMLNGDNLGQDLSLKCAKILRKLNDTNISSVITLILPLTVNQPSSFYNLLLAEPGISLNSKNSIIICSLMGAVLATIDDAFVLKSACIFTSKLLAKNKNNEGAISGFCQNVSNLKHLVSITNELDEETGIEIIRLLKVAILIQRHNKVKLQSQIYQDFRVFFDGSSEKTKRALTLLYHSMIYKNSLITLDSNYILETYHLLLDYALDDTLQGITYLCINAFLQKYQWLAETISTSVHIEVACSSFFNVGTESNILKMLDTWLEVIGKRFFNGFCVIPREAIRSFILRSHAKDSKKYEYFRKLENFRTREQSHFGRTLGTHQ